MNRIASVMVLAAIPFVAAGCLLISVNKQAEPPCVQTQVREVVYTPSTQPATDFTTRMEAAGRITSLNDRDKVYARIARDAAAGGQPGITRDALSRIASLNLRDDATEDAVILLAQRGMKEDALALTQNITSLNTRDRCLAKLASM